MKNEIVQIKINKSDRNFIESLKRKLDKRSFADTFHEIIILFKKNKLHLDLIK